MKKVGIITFQNSYNCGSMLESYALQNYLKKMKIDSELIDFSSQGQKEMYGTYFKSNSLKNIVKNIIIFPHIKKIRKNNEMYKKFLKDNLITSKKINTKDDFKNLDYSSVIAGSDQVWNVTIPDYDKAYFLQWVKNAKKIAYAPSFGAKNPVKYANNLEEIKEMIADFDYLSIRENNGKKWIYDMIKRDVPVLIDPTLLLNADDYEKIVSKDMNINYKYIFLYCPSFKTDICKFVKKISDKYNLPVIAWSAKSFYVKNIGKLGFKLPEYENPSSYLYLIKNAELVFTTSFHGTIFSTIYKKKFFTIKNGEMYGDDDRVMTLINNLGLQDRLLEYKFDNNFDYLKDVDYSNYDNELIKNKKIAENYLKESLSDEYESSK